MVNSGRAKHAPLGGVWGSSPRFFGESKCPEIDSGGIWQPSIKGIGSRYKALIVTILG